MVFIAHLLESRGTVVHKVKEQRAVKGEQRNVEVAHAIALNVVS
jgi:hypothetical protein